MDSRDPLKMCRKWFHIPRDKNGKETIYFCGNSLGLQPRTIKKYIEQELTDWKKLGVEGHFHAKHPWMPYHEFLTRKTARLVGAKNSEVITMNSLTTNLHLMMVSFYRPTSERYKILIEQSAFPSDQYAVQSQIKFHGYDPREALLELKPQEGAFTLRTENIEKTIAEQGDAVALILLGGVNYYTGQAMDMERITKAGHDKGCVVGFDLAHAAGNLILKLHDWNVDFAAWCTYKYLNAGPGGIAGCFIHERNLGRKDRPRFSGWWGHDKKTRFLMGPEFVPMRTAEAWQLSNPPIFQLAALNASLELFDKVGMKKLRTKSERLTGYLEFLIDRLKHPDIAIITPADPDQRGCQLSLRIRLHGKRLFKKLSQQGIICDWREPDVIRIAPVPLYNTFSEVYDFVNRLEENL
jgi:kynureninase